MNSFNLVDAHRESDEDLAFFTFKRNTSFSILDQIYISNELKPTVINKDLIPSLGKEHSLAPRIQITNPYKITKGNRRWIVNESLLEHPDVQKIIPDILKDLFLFEQEKSSNLTNWLNVKSFLRTVLVNKSKEIRKLWHTKNNRLGLQYQEAINQVKDDPQNLYWIDRLALLTDKWNQRHSLNLQEKVGKAAINRKTGTTIPEKRYFLYSESAL